MYNINTLKALAFVLVISCTVTNIYGLGVYNQSGREIKVKVASCSSKEHISSKQNCVLKTITKKKITFDGTETSLTTSQFVICPTLPTHAFLSITNVFDNNYFEITEKSSNVPNNLCMQIISATNDAPLELEVLKTCRMTVYPTYHGLAVSYGEQCF